MPAFVRKVKLRKNAAIFLFFFCAAQRAPVTFATWQGPHPLRFIGSFSARKKPTNSPNPSACVKIFRIKAVMETTGLHSASERVSNYGHLNKLRGLIAK